MFLFNLFISTFLIYLFFLLLSISHLLCLSNKKKSFNKSQSVKNIKIYINSFIRNFIFSKNEDKK